MTLASTATAMQSHTSTSTSEDRIAHPTESAQGSSVRAGIPGEPLRSGSRTRSRLRSRLIWAVAVVAAILLLIFIPPLINANRYQRQIAHSIGASLGRPVHLDNASLHLLPVPGLTLSNFVVSEDPAFGSEPTIRANTVEATLRLGSLWRRPVEFSTVRFVEPSVNLVRNAQGRWNLGDVLLHATHVDTAPTVQTHAGPAPRFPYIEATGGRINIKLGDEKLPFSLTDTEFALWLPSPSQWRVRLKGEPARTDTNLNDPGTLRIEGDLQRAETTNGIPVDLHATWHDAPLGEASRLVNGDDMGWRGILNLDATVAGTLNQAQFGAKLTLGSLRRAEFAATQPLDLQITCGASLVAAEASMNQLRCSMPDSAPTPMLLEAEKINLAHPRLARTMLTADDIPLHWGMLWAALFSSRVPTDLHPGGRISVHLEHGLGNAPVAAQVAPGTRSRKRLVSKRKNLMANAPGFPWSGEIRVEMPPAPLPRDVAVASSSSSENLKTGGAPGGPVLVWRPVPTNLLPGVGGATQPASGGFGFVMEPTVLPLGGANSVTVAASIGPVGYTVAANGNASAADLLTPARYLPQLGDGLEDVLPEPASAADPARMDFDCVHPWGALQRCVALRPTLSSSRSTARLPLSLGSGQVPGPQPQVQLAPRSLSPLDNNPQFGGMPPAASATPVKPETDPKSVYPPLFPSPHP